MRPTLPWNPVLIAVAALACAPAGGDPDAGGGEADAGLVMPECGNAARCGLTCATPDPDPCAALGDWKALPAPVAYWPIVIGEATTPLFQSGIEGGPDATVENGQVIPEPAGLVASAAVFGKEMLIPDPGGGPPHSIPPGSARAELTTSATFSIVAWLRPDRRSASRMVIANQGNGPQGNTGTWFSVTPGGALEGITYGPQGQEKIFASASTVCEDKWSHVAFVVGAGHGKLFIDGALVHDETLGYDGPRFGSSPFTLGKATAGGASSILDGAVDEIAVYGVALTDAQVKLAYGAGFCRQPLR